MAGESIVLKKLANADCAKEHFAKAIMKQFAAGTVMKNNV
jgi:hypothetical protein